MLDWISKDRENDSPGLDHIRAEFGQMLDAGNHIFTAAANALLGGTDLEVIREDLFATDKRINRAEQQIRRELVVHATVHGTIAFPSCLVMMSVAKDAERVGDYAKNIFDLAAMTPTPLSGPLREELIALKDQIGLLLSHCHEAFDHQNKDLAESVIRESKKIEDQCDKKIETLMHSGQDAEPAVVFALAFRYFKRVTSHVFNIATTIVRPIDKIDFTDRPEYG